MLAFLVTLMGLMATAAPQEEMTTWSWKSSTLRRLLSPGRPGKPAGRGRGRTRRTGRGLAGREQQRSLQRRMAGSKRSKRLLGNHRVEETTRAQGPDCAGPPPTT